MGLNFDHFQQKTMDYKWVILPKLGHFETFKLNIPSDRVFCELSEHKKNIRTGWAEQKLWPFKVYMQISI